MANENAHYMIISMNDVVVDVETASKILALTKDAREYERNWSTDAVHVGPLKDGSITMRVLTAPKYAEGIINGPKT